jgi:hypothetical protein
MDLNSDLKKILPLTNFDWPTPLSSEEGQKGVLSLWQAQTDWSMKVGIVVPDKPSPIDKNLDKP